MAYRVWVRVRVRWRTDAIHSARAAAARFDTPEKLEEGRKIRRREARRGKARLRKGEVRG